MAGKPRPLHELVPVRRGDKAYVFRGKWVYLGKWDSDEPSDEAVARLNQLKELWKVDPKAFAKPKSDLLFIELWRAWETSTESPVQANRKDFDRADRLLFGKKGTVGPYLHHDAAKFTARDLKAWQAHLCQLADTDGALLLSRDTVRRCVKIVQRCFAWGVVEGMVDQLHAASMLLVEPPATGKVKENKKRASIDRATSDKILPSLSPPLRDAVQLLWLTTARPSEILGLTVEDIRRTGSILLRGGATLDLEAEGVWAANLEEHKTAGKGFERVVFFGPKAQAILTPYLVGTGYLFKPSEGRAYSVGIMGERRKPGGTGSRKPVKGEAGKRKPSEFYTYGKLATAIRRACKKNKLPHFFPYAIRITASAAIMDSHGKEAAGVYMGHSPRGVTGAYVGSDLRLAAKVARDCG